MPNPKLPHLCFSADHPRENAIGRFFDRYGALPEHAFIENRMLWVGPVPQAKDETSQLALIQE